MLNRRALSVSILSLLAGSSAGLAQLQGSPDRPSPPPAKPAGLDYTEPFFPGATYNTDVPTPESVLGFPVGSRAVSHAQIEAVVKAIAAKSPRCKLLEYGKTHEGRTLYYLVIASEPNLKRIDDLKAGWAKLADPRTCSPADADGLADSLPALAWMAYCIHGDEMSGSDASLAVAHHLAAGTGEDVKQLLDNVVVVIDPLMNPDGRDRFLTMLNQNRTVQPSVDDQSLLHTGFWPAGRMNHYLFDMNRDWIFATQPETRGRLKALLQWPAHYFMESHEMGSQDTFLFMPGREALNPNLPENIKKWESRFAKDQGAAFDKHGWRYYTGEWNDNWYPGYSSSWAALRGMVENLYEQARIQTDAVRRPEGTLEAYREAVHKQLVSSMANLNFLALNRKEVLADYLAEKRKAVAPDAPHAARTFAVVPRNNAARAAQFVELMQLEGFEVYAAAKPFTVGAAGGVIGRDRLGMEVKSREFPVGTLLIPNRHPLARLLAAMLEFDPRMNTKFLADERRELLRFNRSLIYDVTGWSLPMLFDVECYELSSDPRTDAQAAPAPQVNAGKPAAAPALEITNPKTPVAFVIPGDDDASVVAAGRLMQQGIQVRLADKPFQFEAGAVGEGKLRDFPRGSLLITRKDNPPTDADKRDGADHVLKALQAVCEETRAAAVGITMGLGAGDLPDIGGEHFVLLAEPRVAVLGRDPAGPYSYGQAWFVIDHTLGLRASFLDARSVGGADLRRYNVLVIPDGGAGALAGKMDDLKAWVQAGGTLVAIGSSASALAKEKDGLGSTRTIDAALTKPEPFIQAVIREWEGRNTAPDPAQVWSFSPPSGDTSVQFPWEGAATEKLDEDEAKRRDAWRAIFMPAGAVLAGRIDDRAWLTCGAHDDLGYVPLVTGSDTPLVCPPGVSAPVRYGQFVPAPPPPPPPTDKAAPDAGKDEKKEDKKDEKKDDKDKKDDKPKPGWLIAPKDQQMRLRMSGLLWPEAAERLANTAYLTRESIGNGQVILFAGDPNFRAASLGTSRFFQNAVVYGPGMGAAAVIRPRREE